MSPLRSALVSWQYLDENYKHAAMFDREVKGIRAVIFPINAQNNPDEHDVVNHLALFLEFVNSVEPHYEEEEALLRLQLTDCIETH